ncbi:MAG: aminotransferase class V-fold PLP-dependent enzyme [Deltaproteobacteria bacterium]|jgi:cysteine desulfurase family protein|nr:aminotransferase class V-fold PLP-dependent enzyme [Deltaproteobacteria bacterium]
MIYLDNGATSFPKPKEVIDAVLASLSKPASPGRSGHRPALEASRIVYGARKNVAKLFGVPKPERVVFAANITWALNIAIFGMGLKKGDRVLSSSLEHNSVGRPLNFLASELGVIWDRVDPSPETGLLDPAEFKKKLTPETKLVVLAHASNVTGALAPAKAVKEAIGDVPLILDTAQTAGSVPMEDHGSWADILTFTGHKGLLGPTGTGGLCVKEGITLKPLALGGTGSGSEKLVHPDFLPDALEAGTLNTHGLAGLAAGVKFLLDIGLDRVRAHEMELARIFSEGVSKIKGVRILGPGPGSEERVATVSVVLENISSSDLARRLEEDYGIMVRSGLHCSPLAHGASGTFPGGASRFSFGWFNTRAEAETAVKALEALAGAKTGKKS